MEEQQLKKVFDRYMSGEAEPQEIIRLLHYFHLEQESKILTGLILQEMERQSSISQAQEQGRSIKYDRVLAQLNARIDTEQEAKIVTIYKRRLFYQIAAAAAILFIALGLSLWSWQNHSNDYITIVVPYGQMKQVILPDSSKVWLNAGSHFQYPAKFGNKLRSTLLTEGQAFFDVRHKAAPFIIRTGNVNITVLGTSFEVKAFKNEGKTTVTVATGKVGVTLLDGTKKTAYLLPHQQASILLNENKIATNTLKTDIAVWRDNRLIFDNENLNNVFHALERKYKVRFIIKQPQLLQEETSMKLDNQPLSDVLTTLSFSKHFQYQFANDSVIVIP